MKKLIQEASRMQKLAGVITEDLGQNEELNETATKFGGLSVEDGKGVWDYD